MSLLELQGLTIESEAGHRPPGSRASKGCGHSGLSLLLC
ncbi:MULTISPECIES: class III lanthipeptide [unclassified Streptomyces]|nr:MULTISPECIES: class III lanthipeptide [unclassified Streptomyces]MDF3148761.1 class III lanthipeptide [Streptomyces sp. T21Q-yed]WDF42748.1 class III lanthipeptide [Streptomyces sp. T12]